MPAEKSNKKRTRRKLLLLLSVLGLALLLAALVLYHFLTYFDKALAGYAQLCDGSQREWNRQVKEVKGEELTDALYTAICSQGSRVPAKAEHTFTYNTIDGQAVPAVRCQGMFYIVLHKWRNFCAGVCVPVVDGATRVRVRELDYFPVKGSEWLYWKADFEK